MAELCWFKVHPRGTVMPKGLVEPGTSVFMAGYAYEPAQSPDYFDLFLDASRVGRAVALTKGWRGKHQASYFLGPPVTDSRRGRMFCSDDFEILRTTDEHVEERWYFQDRIYKKPSPQIGVTRTGNRTFVKKVEFGGGFAGADLHVGVERAEFGQGTSSPPASDPLLTLMLPWDPETDVRTALREEANVLTRAFDCDSDPYEALLQYLGDFLPRESMGWELSIANPRLEVPPGETVETTIHVVTGAPSAVAFAVRASDPEDPANPNLQDFSDVFVVERTGEGFSLRFGEPDRTD
jgi:hypothetical protein